MKYHVDNFECEDIFEVSNDLMFTKLNDDAVEPIKATPGSAGFDLCANKDVTIEPNKTVMVGTGISVEIPVGYFGGLFARSGLATKRGIRLANSVGVIDSDYRGEVIVALHNDSDIEQTISNGERIAQLIIIPYLNCSAKQANTLSETERGSNGFGSTGKMGVKEHV